MAGYDYDGSNEVVALCPTRENPTGAIEMIESFYDTIHRISSDVVLVVDYDDPYLDQYRAIPDRFRWQEVVSGHMRRHELVRVMEVEGGSLTKATNEAVARMWDSEAIVGHVGDDHRFRTPGWDTRIRDILVNEPGVVYAYDGFRSAWASAWWTNMKIIRTLGWLAVPGSMHLTIDDVFMDIGAGLGRLTFLDDVLIEHLHPAGGKVAWRPIVQSHYKKDRRAKEEANLLRYREEDFARDINRLQEALGLPVTEVVDLSPGKTFRRHMRGQFTIPEGLLREHVQPWPTDEKLVEWAGRPLRNGSADWLRARRAWAREKRA